LCTVGVFCIVLVQVLVLVHVVLVLLYLIRQLLSETTLFTS
jgi:hypothetical protein